MIVRKAKSKDISECVKLSEIKEFIDPFDDYPDEEYLTDSLNKIFLVLEEDDKVIGFILGYPLTKKLVYLDLFTIKKDYRSKNSGKMLLDAFKKELEKKGINYYFLIAPSFNKRTLNFYKKMGLKKGHQYTLFAEKL